jgi:hypothetical protein
VATIKRLLLLVLGVLAFVPEAVGQQAENAEAPKGEVATQQSFDLSKWLTNFH